MAADAFSFHITVLWLKPEIDLVSRDRGQIYREAATQGAPQAKQVVDRYHLQKNFAEALEKFFRKQERVLKKVTEGSVNSSEKIPKSAIPKVSRVGNCRLTLDSASLKFPRTPVR